MNENIDWEQRMYEIVKEMLSVIYSDDNPQEGKDYLTLQQTAKEAIRCAGILLRTAEILTRDVDILIKELEK